MNLCPICNDHNKKTFLCKVNLIYGVDYDLVECNNCKAIYYDPVPTDKELGIFYSAGGYEFDRWKQEAKARFFARKFLKREKRGRFLDIGCASGYFINGIRQYSEWDVFGVDVGERPVRFAKEVLGLNVLESDIVNAGFPDNYFDFIHVNDVLEHVRNPVETLRECRRIIKADGNLFLSIPNGENDCRNLIDFYKKKERPAREFSGHIYFFPKQTLSFLFDQIGFEVISKKTFHLKRGLRNMGAWPKKLGWAGAYEPSQEPEKYFEGDIPLVKENHRPDFYYDLRFYKKNCFRLPGLYFFGHNFQFLLKPKQAGSVGSI